MQSDFSKFDRALKKANLKVKPLNIEIHQSRLRIRVRRKDINFTKNTFEATQEGLEATVAICQDILKDYYRGCFDQTLVKYGLASLETPRLTEIIHLPTNSEPTLDIIWENYKTLKPDVSNNTLKNRWNVIDRWLSQCPKECLLIDNSDQLLAYLRTKHKDGGILYPLQTLSTAVNLSVKLKRTTFNPLPTLLALLEIDNPKSIQIYTKQEAKTILQAFKDGRFDNNYSAYSSSYYAPYVEFRILTGCRPSEAIALTWNDIKDNGDKCQIIFNKRYTSGQLLQGTKNGVDARIFPCNQQLTDFLRSLPRIPNDHDLIFPTFRGNYIYSDNFHSRYWQPIVRKLFEQKAISKELVFYDLRHSFITWLVRSGTDIKTIAAICGNSAETIMKHYLATNTEIELPEI
jgi:integrase